MFTVSQAVFICGSSWQTIPMQVCLFFLYTLMSIHFNYLIWKILLCGKGKFRAANLVFFAVTACSERHKPGIIYDHMSPVLSPNYPDNFPTSQFCVWHLRAERNHVCNIFYVTKISSILVGCNFHLMTFVHKSNQ